MSSIGMQFVTDVLEVYYDFKLGLWIVAYKYECEECNEVHEDIISYHAECNAKSIRPGSVIWGN